MSNWDDFCDTADQFFISYSISFEEPLLPVKLFEIGHTIELYLKAAYIKKTGDIEKAIKFNHRIKQIWYDCKVLDSTFMPNYEIKDSIFNSDFIIDSRNKSSSNPPRSLPSIPAIIPLLLASSRGGSHFNPPTSSSPPPSRSHGSSSPLPAGASGGRRRRSLKRNCWKDNRKPLKSALLQGLCFT
jgi:hypothetical protein